LKKEKKVVIYFIWLSLLIEVFMYCLRTLTALTAFFLSTSVSLFAMDENYDFDKMERKDSVSNSSSQKTENLEKEIFNVISKHEIPSEKLKELTNQYFLVQAKFLAQKSINIIKEVFGKGISVQYSKEANFLNTYIKFFDETMSPEKSFEKDFEKDLNLQEGNARLLKLFSTTKLANFFKQPVPIQNVASDIHQKYVSLQKEWEESKIDYETFLLKKYASFYAKNPFCLNSFFDNLNNLNFFQLSLKVFFIERLSFDLIKNLYLDSYVNSDVSFQDEKITYEFFNNILQYAFPKESTRITNILNAANQESMLNGTASKQSKKIVRDLLTLFQEDKEKKPFPFLCSLVG
jgi:hypothetical protein